MVRGAADGARPRGATMLRRAAMLRRKPGRRNRRPSGSRGAVSGRMHGGLKGAS